jgi:hypothetical protein
VPSHAGVPFALSGSGASLPAGTLLTVRLENMLTGANSGSGATFTAALEDSVEINGNTIVPRGTLVRGRLESARASSIKGSLAYVRLTLVSIVVAGRDVPLQSSSLFARGQAAASGPALNAAFSHGSTVDGNSGVRIQKGRFLTFRLSSPVKFPAIDAGQVSQNSSPPDTN